MKTVLALILSIFASVVWISCGSWPYKPTQFIAPVIPPPPNAFVSKDSLVSFVGITNAHIKFAYALTPTASSQKIYFVDFNDSAIAPKEIKKDAARQDWDAWCPIISPDGSLITYYLLTGTDAAVYCQPLDTAATPVAIADPGSEPHFFKDNHGNLLITYTDANGIMLTGTYTTITGYHTYKQKIDPVSGQKIGPPDTIAGYPFYGDMSKDGQFICTGYASAYIYSCISKTFFSINQGQQTCNPSMTADSTLSWRMMFLNWGGHENLKSLPPEDTGKIGQHKFVFIADTGNNWVADFNLDAMLPDYSNGVWQCPKWTNVPDFFCALASKLPEGSNTYIFDCYLISISTKKTLLLNVKPTFLQFESSSKPYVYIGKNEP